MSIEQLTPPRAPRSSGERKLVQYDQYIDTQIKNTRRAVKLVDLATSLVLMATGVLAFLLAAAVVEHWLVPGGFPVAVRSVLFLILVGGVGYVTYQRVWPLVRRAINPVYAAQTIERSSPSLKNSLVNLLLFRQHREELPDVVYRTLEQQAAQRLSHVPVDAAVDRSLLIRVGYGLLAVVALAALYKILSPKDPIITAERLLMPWANIVPASRVSIRDIRPGSLTVSQGDSVDVSAEIRGVDEDDAVLLRYTTDDGQAVDKPVEMTLTDDGLRFEARLPDESDADFKLGLAQNVRYYIEAGDARSLEYALKVVPAPTILVERVEYEFPEYTGYIDRSVDGLGDIRGIEGTRVTVHARANGPIGEAHVDFDADGRRDLEMTSKGAVARTSFVLQLREDRQTPRHASYVLRFTNDEGRTNRDPVKHPIVVEPDLQPETAILSPREKTIDVKLNDTVAIEVEARDPDFALSEVKLRGESAGRNVFDQPLFTGTHKGRLARRYEFNPGKHDLKAGDVVQYWVTARDNRTPNANVGESERKFLRIVSPDPNQPPPDQLAQNDPRQKQQDGQQGEANQQDGQRGQQGNQQGGQAQNGSQQQDGQGQQGGEQQDGQFSREAQPSADQADGQASAENPRQGDAQQQPGGEQSDTPDGQPSGAESQRSTDNETGSGSEKQGEQRADQTGERSGQQNGSRTNHDNNGTQNGEQTGAGSAGGDSQKGSQPGGARPDRSNASRPTDGSNPNADERAKPSPVSADGDNDAEAFKRIQKHLERRGELQDGESAQPDSNQGSPNEQPNDEGQRENDSQIADGRDQQGDSETGRQGGSQQEPDQKSNLRDGEAASADGDNKAGGQDNQEPNGEERSNDRARGTGAETRPDDMPEDAQKQPDGAGDEQQESPGGQQTSSKGPSGAGNQQQSQGAPNSQPEMKPAEKRQQSGSSNEQTDEKEPPAGARGKRESDSHGEEGGDNAGGGEEGGGQKSPREGTGSAGQNQSADEGAGESSEKGQGNTSPDAGSDTIANDRTGQSSGETEGRGTKQRDGTGNEPGGEAGSGKDGAQNEPFSREPQPSAGERDGQGDEGRQGDDQSAVQSSDETAQRNGQPGERGGDQNAKSGRQQGGAPTGEGGESATAQSPSRTTQGEVPPGDAANLEYARKQTDLVLDKLADQLKKQEVDDQLLEDLGWTEEDMRRFLERWHERKEAARRNDPAGEAAQRELDEALLSLGLERGELRQNQVQDDTQRDLREGYRGPVPLRYQDRLRQYNRGVSRARKERE